MDIANNMVWRRNIINIAILCMLNFRTCKYPPTNMKPFWLSPYTRHSEESALLEDRQSLHDLRQAKAAIGVQMTVDGVGRLNR